MIREDDLIEAIAECHGQREPNANTCIKLAAYYIILNEMKKGDVTPELSGYSYEAAEPQTYESETEFGQIVPQKDTLKVMELMDEIMTTIKIYNPRLYDMAMRKLTAL